MTIRPAALTDAEAIAAIYRPYVTDTVITFELDPPDAAEMRRRIETVTATHPWLVAERDGVVIERMAGLDIFLDPAMVDARDTERVRAILGSALAALTPKAAT